MPNGCTLYQNGCCAFNSIFFFYFGYFETRSHFAVHGGPRLVAVPLPQPPNAGIMGVYNHAWPSVLFNIWNSICLLAGLIIYSGLFGTVMMCFCYPPIKMPSFNSLIVFWFGHCMYVYIILNGVRVRGSFINWSISYNSIVVVMRKLWTFTLENKSTQESRSK